MSIRIGREYRLKEIGELDWKQAEGITDKAKTGTNSMLAERDYSIKCKTGSEPIAVVNGVWLWYCDCHHQPLAWCDKAKAKKRALSFAESVVELDKTPRYEYGRGNENANNNGDLPEHGQRWATPIEMARDFISYLKR